MKTGSSNYKLAYISYFLNISDMLIESDLKELEDIIDKMMSSCTVQFLAN